MASNAMKALLGVLAVAGYQNRDKIGEILQGLRNQPRPDNDGRTQSGGIGEILGGLGDFFQGGAGGGSLSGGLGDLFKQFEQKGEGETAKSWVEPGPNKDIGGRQLSEVLGADVLDDLSAKTGLSRDEILSRLSRDLPKAVDDMTPGGQLPSEEPDDLSTGGPASFSSVNSQIV